MRLLVSALAFEQGGHLTLVDALLVILLGIVASAIGVIACCGLLIRRPGHQPSKKGWASTAERR
jgi:hypothetical protein